MNEIAEILSKLFIPAVLSLIILYGFVKKANVYKLFIEGCNEGLQTAAEILPYIIAIFVAISIVTQSGLLQLAESTAEPFLEAIGIPKELISFIIIRPVSGSGTLVIVQEIADKYGADSYLCRCASVMMGSSETILYAVAVYFGATAVKKMRHTVVSGVAGYIVGIWFSLILCRIL